MFRNDLKECSTWELADDLFRFRWAELNKPKRSRRSKVKAVEATKILVNRHKPLLAQICSRSGLAHAPYHKQLFETYLLRTVFKLKDGTWGSPQADSFSVTLWNCALAQVNADVRLTPPQQKSLQNLKPRFMLRQYVDAMLPGAEKSLLVDIVYGATPPTAAGILQMKSGLRDACVALRQVALYSGKDVSALSGGSIVNADLLRSDGVDIIERWLLGG
jgi:hypothetical protein